MFMDKTKSQVSSENKEKQKILQPMKFRRIKKLSSSDEDENGKAVSQ